MTVPPINHASARDLAALLYSFDDEDEAMKVAAITVRAIIDGRDRLGLTRDDATILAAHYIGAALAEYDRLRARPPQVH